MRSPTGTTSLTGRARRSARSSCGWRRGAIDKTQAADALDKLLYAWRGDERELALRERVAELRGQTGAWRVALSTAATGGNRLSRTGRADPRPAEGHVRRR